MINELQLAPAALTAVMAVLAAWKFFFLLRQKKEMPYFQKDTFEFVNSNWRKNYGL